MKKPKQYDLKKWLCENLIVGLKVRYYQTGTDTSDTDWELMPAIGKAKRVKARSVEELVDVKPNWSSVLQLKECYRVEVGEWDNFRIKESKDFAEYERLKRKFSETEEWEQEQ